MLLGFINTTSAEQNGVKSSVEMVMKIELFLIIVSLIGQFLAFHLLYATTQYHINLTLIFVNFVVQYLISLVSKIYIITSQLAFRGENLLGTPYFDIAIVIRTLCTITCLVVYSGVVFERVLATIFVKDYEVKSRKWIPIVVIIATWIQSGTATYLVYKESLKISTLAISLVVINIVDFIITFVAYYYSKKRVPDGSILEGVLSWRYQQEENFRSWLQLRYLLSVIVFFNICMCICLCIPDYLIDNNPHHQNITSLTLDQTIIMYGLVAPFVALYFNKLWQKEIIRLLKMYKMGCLVSILLRSYCVVLPSPPEGLQETHQQDAYFSQLTRSWDTARIKKDHSSSFKSKGDKS